MSVVKWIGLGLKMCVVLGAWKLVPLIAFAESRVPELPAMEDVVPQLQWTVVDSASERRRVLDLLLVHMRANYERLRTFKGTYTLQLQQELTKNAVSSMFSDTLKVDQISALTQQVHYTMQLAIDFESGSIYRSSKAGDMRFFKSGTTLQVEVPNVGAADGNSIATSEHYEPIPEPYER